jgi:hypothetical protein
MSVSIAVLLARNRSRDLPDPKQDYLKVHLQKKADENYTFLPPSLRTSFEHAIPVSWSPKMALTL